MKQREKITVRARAKIRSILAAALGLTACFAVSALLLATVTHQGNPCVILLKDGREINTFEPRPFGSRFIEYFDKRDLRFRYLPNSQVDTVLYLTVN